MSKAVLRKLPDGWRCVRLGELCEVKGGKRLPAGADFTKETTTFPYIRVVDFKNGSIDIRNLKYLSQEVQVQISQYIINRTDVYISIAGTIGICGVIPDELDRANLTENAARLIIKDKTVLHRDYLFRFLASPMGQLQIKQKTNAVGQPKLALERAKTIELLLPPLPEQKRIATILNEQMAAFEKARIAAETQREAATALPSAYLREIFHGNEAQRWPIMKFEDIAYLQRGHDLPAHKQVPGDYPIVTSSGHAGTHIEYRAKGPGVVTGRSGSIGKVHYVDEDFWPHNTALFVKNFRCNEPRFIFYLLQWIGLKGVSSGSGVPTLDRKQVHKLQVRCPVISEQKRIVAIIDEQMAEAEKLKKSIEDQLNAIKTLPSARLRQAFSGEL